MPNKEWRGARVAQARRRLREATAWPAACARCGGPVEEDSRWHLDHRPGLADLPEQLWDDARYHFVAHASCNLKAGSLEGHRRKALKRAQRDVAPRGERRESPALVVESVPLEVWPDWWPAEFRAAPEDSRWPWTWTGVHPDAVGSLGADAAVWIEGALGMPLRWWQRFALWNLLCFDAGGAFVWRQAGVSTARQVGKSVLLRGLALWRIANPALFGESQLVMTIANQVQTAMEVFLPARDWADQQHGWDTRSAHGSAEVMHWHAEYGKSRWLPRSQRAAYGFSSSLGMVDEAWNVASTTVWTMLKPTLVSKRNSQLVLFSTAHFAPTPLWSGFVSGGGVENSRLVLAWQADPARDVADPLGWREASPYWDAQREREIRADLQTMDARTFATQWLNRWPSQADGRWLPPNIVDGLRDRNRHVARPVVGAVDCVPGGEFWSAARAGWYGSKAHVEVMRFGRLADAVEWLRGVPLVLAYRSICETVPPGKLMMEPVGVAVEVAAVETLGAAIKDRSFTVGSGGWLVKQFDGVSVAPVLGGNKLDATVSATSIDGVRAVSFALHRLTRQSASGVAIMVSPRRG